jgi:hypothetical protein
MVLQPYPDEAADAETRGREEQGRKLPARVCQCEEGEEVEEAEQIGGGLAAVG